MKLPEKISPVIMLGSIVIVVGIVSLLVLSPVPSIVYGFFHQPDPHAICLYPPVEETTMNAFWNTIANRSGIDPGSAQFGSMQVRLNPDETIEEIQLSFYATKNGEDRRYQTDLRYDPEHCGALYISSDPTARYPGSTPRSSRSPIEILRELSLLRPSVVGITDKPVRISAETQREINATYDRMPCEGLFLLRNGSVTPESRIMVHGTQEEVTHWNILSEHCVPVPGYEPACISEKNILVLSGQQIPGAEFVTGTGNVPEEICTAGPVVGQSCKSTIWGESCMNWTA